METSDGYSEFLISNGQIKLMVCDTYNFHFDTIPSSVGISIDGIDYRITQTLVCFVH